MIATYTIVIIQPYVDNPIFITIRDDLYQLFGLLLFTLLDMVVFPPSLLYFFIFNLHRVLQIHLHPIFRKKKKEEEFHQLVLSSKPSNIFMDLHSLVSITSMRCHAFWNYVNDLYKKTQNI